MIAYDARAESLFHPERVPAPALPAQADLALVAAAAARAAYHPGGAARQQALRAFGATEVGAIDRVSTDSQGLVALWREQWLIVALRGTQVGTRDVLTDLMLYPAAWAPVPGARVHTGFLQASRSIQDDPGVQRLLATHRPGRQLLLCGHSLGGALATLLAAAWQPERVITIGSPRVGNRVFAQWLDAQLGARHTRVVHALDAVPMVPPGRDGDSPPSWGAQRPLAALAAQLGQALRVPMDWVAALGAPDLGYAHTGQRLYIDRQGLMRPQWSDAQIQEDRREALWQDLRPQAAAARLMRGELASRLLSDHTPDNYLRGLMG